MLQPPLPRDDSPTNNTNSILSGNSLKGKETLRKEEDCNMPVHHGGKVGKEAKWLRAKLVPLWQTIRQNAIVNKTK